MVLRQWSRVSSGFDFRKGGGCCDVLLLGKPEAGHGELKSIEVGTRLSGRQVRRVFIARAFQRDARILLLVLHRPRALAFVDRVVKVGQGMTGD